MVNRKVMCGMTQNKMAYPDIGGLRGKERAGKKSKRKDCGKEEEAGDFLSINARRKGRYLIMKDQI
jgi:hypothetical protein